MTPSRLKHSPDKCRSFRSGVDMGDQIYSLIFAKKLNTKKIYLDWEQKDGFYTRDGYITNWKNKFNKTSADFLLPLFKYQSYLETVELFDSQDFDLDYGEWDQGVPLHSGTNLLDFHATKFDFNWEDCQEPWLEAPKSDKPLLSNINYIINRTPRHNSGDEKFKGLLNVLNPDKCMYVGIPSEYEKFLNDFKFATGFYKAEDALDLAGVINAVPNFIGNQSLPCAIAKGLGKNCLVELGAGSANYVFHLRKDISYF